MYSVLRDSEEALKFWQRRPTYPDARHPRPGLLDVHPPMRRGLEAVMCSTRCATPAAPPPLASEAH